MNGISAPIKETQESPLPLLLCDVAAKKTAVYEPESGLLPVTTSAGALILDLLIPQIVRNTFVAYESPSLW